MNSLRDKIVAIRGNKKNPSKSLNVQVFANGWLFLDILFQFSMINETLFYFYYLFTGQVFLLLVVVFGLLFFSNYVKLTYLPWRQSSEHGTSEMTSLTNGLTAGHFWTLRPRGLIAGDCRQQTGRKLCLQSCLGLGEGVINRVPCLVLGAEPLGLLCE